MEIKFITNREDHQVSFPRASIEECKEYLKTLDLIGIDTENSSLFPLHANRLLLQIGDDKITYVIDRTSVDILWLNEFKDKRFIGQNIKYDYQILKVDGVELRNLEDLMITEQCLGLGSGRKNSLDAIIERRLGIQATHEKITRNEFINGRKNFIFYDRHIEYAAEDIKFLHPVKAVQQPIIDNLNERFWLEEIEYPLIPILGDCELRGINLNVQKWKENIIKNKKKKYELEIKLDQELCRLTEIKEEECGDSFNGGKFSRKRNDMPELLQGGLFGDEKIIKVKNKANVNYGSPQQLKDIFTRLKEPVPTDKYGKETVGVEHLQKYIIDTPDTIMYKFIELLIDYSDVSQKIDAFGQGHIDVISPVTNKIHTIYRQSSAATGRFQSGNMEHGFFNSQQIPADNDYRHCFTASPGYKILTIDLASAELIILGSLANDPKLLKLQAEDIHGYLATAAYNNILMDIRKFVIARKEGVKEHHVKQVQELLSGFKDDEQVSYDKAKQVLEDFMEGVALTISKKKDGKEDDAKYIEFGWIRDNFKNVVYGLIYGATSTRISEVLGVSKAWAEIVLKTLRKELPVTFDYLDKVAKIASTEGFVILSTRTNARRWFQKVLEARKQKIQLHFSDKNAVEREAKNAPIQGTNAFIIKEAIVRIANEYIRPNNLDAHMLMQVHDELVYEYREELGQEFCSKIHEILTDTAKRYLAKDVSMGASWHFMDHWHK